MTYFGTEIALSPSKAYPPDKAEKCQLMQRLFSRPARKCPLPSDVGMFI